MVESGARVAVIGGGLIGIGWSALFMAHGHDVALFEPDAAARAAIPGRIPGPLAQIAELAPDLPVPGALTMVTFPAR